MPAQIILKNESDYAISVFIDGELKAKGLGKKSLLVETLPDTYLYAVKTSWIQTLFPIRKNQTNILEGETKEIVFYNSSKKYNLFIAMTILIPAIFFASNAYFKFGIYWLNFTVFFPIIVITQSVIYFIKLKSHTLQLKQQTNT